MTDLPAGQPVFRKVFSITIEARSYEEAQENFRAEIGGTVAPSGCDVLFEEIHAIDEKPVREGSRGLQQYPATATLVALTDSRLQANAAFANLVGSVTYAIGGPEIFFEAMDPGDAEEGTLRPPPA